MRPYAIIDLHCDTLTDCMYAASEIPDTLDDPARSLSLSNIPEDVHWAQFFCRFSAGPSARGGGCSLFRRVAREF